MVDNDRPAVTRGDGAGQLRSRPIPTGNRAARITALFPLATVLLKVFLATLLVTGLFGIVPGEGDLIS